MSRSMASPTKRSPAERRLAELRGELCAEGAFGKAPAGEAATGSVDLHALSLPNNRSAMKFEGAEVLRAQRTSMLPPETVEGFVRQRTSIIAEFRHSRTAIVLEDETSNAPSSPVGSPGRRAGARRQRLLGSPLATSKEAGRPVGTAPASALTSAKATVQNMWGRSRALR
mmetsp:Transcript_34463/g.100028  ORF Transcript_34463/g.100028 Transcript_34463/m.100028 type:complete len:170 (-) Transcript_34463:143-652(-)